MYEQLVASGHKDTAILCNLVICTSHFDAEKAAKLSHMLPALPSKHVDLEMLVAPPAPAEETKQRSVGHIVVCE